MQRLSDVQWERIREHLPEENLPDDRPGRKPIPSQRKTAGACAAMSGAGSSNASLSGCNGSADYLDISCS